MGEHLTAWGIAWAELTLTGLETRKPITERLSTVPNYPLVEMDFSFLVPKTTRYSEVVRRLRSFRHTLLKHIRYVDSYEGGAIGPDHRSLTFRTVIGDDRRTLIEQDTRSFRRTLEEYLTGCGYQMRR